MKTGMIRIASWFIGMIFLFAILLGGNIHHALALRSMSSLDNPEIENLVEPSALSLPFRTEHLIIKMKDTRHLNSLGELKLNNDANIIKKFRSGAELIRLPGITKDELAKIKDLLSKSSLVEYVEYDYLVQAASYPSNDPLFFRLWGLQNTGQLILLPGTPGIDINVVPAWEIPKAALTWSWQFWIPV